MDHVPQQPYSRLQQSTYLLANIISATAIVFANKAVFSVYKFNFTVALTFIHTLATWLASNLLVATNVITPRALPPTAICSLAGAFAGYIILSNASLLLNSVGFYQMTKIAIAPTVLLLECCSERKAPDFRVAATLTIVCIGIGIATISDAELATNIPGILVGIASTLVSAKYGIWIGTMTKHYKVTPLQLLQQYVPAAAAIMCIVTLATEALDLKALFGRVMAGATSFNPLRHARNTEEHVTLFAYAYTLPAVSMIVLSAVLGALVTFSTFLTINATSPLTYSVSGHIKTALILAGGVTLFGESITPAKLGGIVVALSGIVAYSLLRLQIAAKRSSQDTACPGEPHGDKVLCNAHSSHVEHEHDQPHNTDNR